MSTIGEKIREFRKWRGLTQQQLADASEISVMSIRRYESGEREPTENAVKAIALALEVNPAEIDSRFIVFLGSDVMVEAEDGEIIRASMDTREGKMLSRFQALNELGKDEVIRYTDILLEANKYRRVPLDQPPVDVTHFLSLISTEGDEPPQD